MTTHRIDLGSNCWMAAIGQAFVYVRVKRGHSVNITLAPVRDVVVKRSVVFENPWHTIIASVSLLISLPGFIWYILNGAYNSFWGWLFLAALAVNALIIAISLYRRRGRLVILYGFGKFGGPRRIDFMMSQTQRPEFADFVERLENLSSVASKKPREFYEYSLNALWIILIVSAGAIAIFTGLVPFFWNEAETPQALAVAIVLASVSLMFSSEKYLLVLSDLRNAHSKLLYCEPDAAIRMLQRFLLRKPNHPYATKLMTIAELLRGNMDVAEEIIVRGDTFEPNQKWLLPRMLQNKPWETDHDNR